MCTLIFAELPRADWPVINDLMERSGCRMLRAYTIEDVMVLLKANPEIILVQELPYELSVGDLTISRHTHEVSAGSKRVLVTPTEMNLLWFLAERPDQWISVQDLLAHVWGDVHDVLSLGRQALVRVHVRNIRMKIEPDYANPMYLMSMPCHGYMLSSEGGPASE